MNEETNPDIVVEYWNVQCPHCLHCARIRFVTNPCMRRTKWPVLRCRCGKYFHFLVSRLANFCGTAQEKSPDDFWLCRSRRIEADSVLHNR